MFFSRSNIIYKSTWKEIISVQVNFLLMKTFPKQNCVYLRQTWKPLTIYICSKDNTNIHIYLPDFFPAFFKPPKSVSNYDKNFEWFLNTSYLHSLSKWVHAGVVYINTQEPNGVKRREIWCFIWFVFLLFQIKQTN